MANLVTSMSTMAAGALLVTSGVLDPPGGPLGVVKSLMSGKLPVRTVKNGISWEDEIPGGGGEFGGGTSTPPPAASSGKAGAIVASARAQIGKPYVWGGNGPGVFDCSGLVFYTHNQAGVRIGDSTAEGYRVAGRQGTGAAGDVVCFGAPATHIGIVSGPGRCIEAPNRNSLVQERAINMSGRNRPITYRRLY